MDQTHFLAFRRTAVAVIALALVLPHGASFADAPEGDHDKTLYFLGTAMGHSLQNLGLNEAELKIIMQGILDVNADRAVQLDPEVYQPKLQTLQEERSKLALAQEVEKAANFLAAQKKEAGAKTTESGIVYTVLDAGAGESPSDKSRVRVRYKGTLRDGRVFDERTTEFPLGSVIPCWKESVSMMKVGGHHKIVCPPDLAYGERGAGLIPPGAVLVFDVELLEILQ